MPAIKRATCLLLLLGALLQAGVTAADSTNARPCDSGAAPPLDPSQPGYDERLLGVCALENTSTTLTYQPSSWLQGQVAFSVRSCSPDSNSALCNDATPYAVTLNGTTTKNGKKFVLQSDSGPDEVRVNLTYRSGGAAETLDPGTESALFPGGASGLRVPAAIEVELQTRAQLAAGSYSGTFSMSVVQCGSKNTNNAVPCDGSKPTTRLAVGEEITFTIRLVVQPIVRISGLEDMELLNDGSGTYTASQQFCVFGSLGTVFRISADSLAGTGSFLLQGASEALPYRTTVADVAGTTSEQLQEGVISSSTWTGHPEDDCLGYAAENMSLVISVLAADMAGATENSYTDTLTLTVEAQ